VEVPIYDFPINAYSQDINTYIPKDSNDYTKLLLSEEYQAKQVRQFFNHYYASDEQGLSPWSDTLVQTLLPTVKNIEQSIIDDFDNQKQEPKNYHFAENFKEHDPLWLAKIVTNMNLETLSLTVNRQNKAIIVHNTFARALPDIAPDFFHFSLAGQGFPFDNLQESSIWVGTPVYVLHVSQDKAWSLVLTPDAYFAWVKSDDIAYTSADFIKQWQTKAQAGLMAIIKTEAPVINEKQQFLFTGYIGAVFPLVEQAGENTTLLIPIKNQDQQAVLAQGKVQNNATQRMPLSATKKHIAQLIQQLQNRPYGWGGAFFFNDCSQELKSLFTPFGIWLPRNSSQQARLTSLDLSTKNPEERIQALTTQGHPLMTIIYIGGHVMLYLGSYKHEDQESTPITYQNIWGLAPPSKDKRYILGQSVLLPLLKYYPEYPDARSLAGSSYFKLIFLDELNPEMPPARFIKHFRVNASERELH
jgi:cell wall-associated NlpC family hydrolase